MSLSKPREIVKDKEAWCATVHGVPKSQIRQGLNNKNNGKVLRVHRGGNSSPTGNIYLGHPWWLRGKEANAGDAGPSLDQEDLEKEKATHSGILAWEIPWPEEPDGLQSLGHKESDMNEHVGE